MIKDKLSCVMLLHRSLRACQLSEQGWQATHLLFCFDGVCIVGVVAQYHISEFHYCYLR